MSSIKAEVTKYICDTCAKEIYHPGPGFPSGWYIEKLKTKWYQLPSFRDYCENCLPAGVKL